MTEIEITKGLILGDYDASQVYKFCRSMAKMIEEIESVIAPCWIVFLRLSRYKGQHENMVSLMKNGVDFDEAAGGLLPALYRSGPACFI